MGSATVSVASSQRLAISEVAVRRGFEPRLKAPKTSVLPLHHRTKRGKVNRQRGARKGKFRVRRHGRGASILEKLRAQDKSSNFQTPSSKAAASSKLKTQLRAVCPGICIGVWCFQIWNFSGARGLVLGVSPGGESKMRLTPSGWRRRKIQVVVRRPAAREPSNDSLQTSPGNFPATVLRRSGLARAQR